MLKFLSLIGKLFLLLLAWNLQIANVLAQATYSDNELIIQFSNTAKLDFTTNLYKALKIQEDKEFQHNTQFWQLDFPVILDKQTYTSVDELLPYLNMLPEIEYAEPNFTVGIDVLPNDIYFLGYTWAPNNYGQFGGMEDADIDAVEAWDIQNTSPNVVVGVLDTGIDWTHPDLVNNIWQNLGEDADGDGSVLEWNGTTWIFDPDDVDGLDSDNNGYADDFIGWDFINEDNNPMDDNGHGTHVAGTIGAEGNNGLGVAGITWDVQLMPLKFISANECGKIADAVEAMNYAQMMGADLTNNSWGSADYSITFYNTLVNADAQGQLFVAAAGNSSINTDNFPHYPAAYTVDNIITVGASNRHDGQAWFSNFGVNSVDVFAPGESIISTSLNGSYDFKDGTSMAAPQISGALALLIHEFPSLDHLSLKNKLLTSADPLGSLAGKCLSGGRLNLYNMLKGNVVETNFTYLKNNLSVDFSLLHTSPNSTYQWDFGDGNAAIGVAPTHVYLAGGTYQVCLTGTNYVGVETSCSTINVETCTSLENDSLLLVDFYNQMGGANWTTPWDLSTPVATWQGVSLDVTACQVVELDLSNNNLVGILPDMTDFPSLYKLDVTNNQLDFDELKTNLVENLSLNDFCYNPQGFAQMQQVGDDYYATYPDGDMANSTYVWLRNGVYYASVIGNNSISPTLAGDYRLYYVVNSTLTRPASCQQLYIRGSAADGLPILCDEDATFIVKGQSCSTFSATFSANNTTPNINYRWFVDGNIVATTSNFTYNFPSEGNYTIQLEIENAYCITQHEEEIGIGNSASLLNLPTEIEICDNQGILDAGLLGMSDYQWYLDGVWLDSLPVLSISSEGLYSLVVTDYCNSSATASTFVSAFGACVWPGDFDHNGLVNYEDIFTYGFAKGKTGFSRQNSSSAWAAQACQDWSSSSFANINDKYSDGNGDGVINTLDLQSIVQAYGESHTQGNSVVYPINNNVSYKIKPRIDKGRSTDSTLHIRFELKSNNGAPLDIYALGFQYFYGESKTSMTADYSSSVLGDEGLDMIAVSSNAKGAIDVGMTRLGLGNKVIDGDVVSGYVSIQDLTSGGLYSRFRNIRVIQEDGNEVLGQRYVMNAFFNTSADSSDIELTDLSTNSPVEFYINALPYTCGIANETEITVFSGTAPYTYLWSNGETTAIATGLGLGDYQVTVSDATGAFRVGNIHFDNNQDFAIGIQTTNSFDDLANGTATATVTGLGAFTYQWNESPPSTSPIISGLGTGMHQLIVYNTMTGCFKTTHFLIEKEYLTVRVKLLLEGNYDETTNLMNDILRQEALLPLVSPYDNTQILHPDILNRTGPTAITDWVEVELWNAVASNCLARTSALLQRGGDVVGLDGVSSLHFEGYSKGYYHLTIRHRNHLAIRTENPIWLSGGLGDIVDFTQGNAYGLGATNTLTNNRQAIWTGDANNDGLINAGDRAAAWNNRNQVGYNPADINLDGVVNAADRAKAWNNRNRAAAASDCP